MFLCRNHCQESGLQDASASKCWQVIKSRMGNKIRNEMMTLHQINAFGGRKERRNTKGKRATAYYRGIKKRERNAWLSNVGNKKSKKLYWLYIGGGRGVWGVDPHFFRFLYFYVALVSVLSTLVR